MGHKTAQTLAWIIALSILLAPAQAVHRPSLRDAFHFAPPHVWAIGWVILGAWAILALTFRNEAAPYPYETGILTAGFGFFTITTHVDGSGGIFGVYTFVALAACALLAGHNIGEEP